MTHEYTQRIFCFDEGTDADIFTMREVCEKIGQVLITDKRQVLGAIHYLDTDKPHCHYLINYVGVDGSSYQQRFSVLHYKKLVNEILAEYDFFQPIKFYENENTEVIPVQKKECPWTIDERFIQQMIQDTAVSVDQFMANNSNVQMTSPVVTYSDENFRYSSRRNRRTSPTCRPTKIIIGKFNSATITTPTISQQLQYQV